MLNPKIEAEIVKNKVCINLTRCPVCDSFSTYAHYMKDAKTKLESLWHQCHCGTIWQKDKAKNKYGQEYFNNNNDSHIKVTDCLNYCAKLYLPIIEEMMYGRKVLHVGYMNDCQKNLFVDMGWVFKSLDLENKKADIVDNIETYKCDTKYNLIWMPMILECLEKPKETLLRIKDMLAEDGIIFIETPDTNFLSIRSPSGFVHWKKEHNNLMWRKEKLVEYLEQIGFKVSMARNNYEHRFMFVDTVHIIAQKKFF